MHKFREIDRYMVLALLLATASGALAGIIAQFINDIFSKIENQPPRSTISRLKSYARASLMFGIQMGILAGAAVIFPTDTPVQYVKQYFVPFAIIATPLIVLTTKLLVNFVFKKQDN